MKANNRNKNAGIRSFRAWTLVHMSIPELNSESSVSKEKILVERWKRVRFCRLRQIFNFSPEFMGEHLIVQTRRYMVRSEL